MTTAHLCLGLAMLTPYLFTGIAKMGGPGFGLTQNRDPRAFLEGLDGFRRRADSAQKNSFEVVPAFGLAVLLAHQVGHAAQATIDLLAVVFVVSRLLYGACYIANWGAARSLMFLVGGSCVAGLFIVSA